MPSPEDISRLESSAAACFGQWTRETEFKPFIVTVSRGRRVCSLPVVAPPPPPSCAGCPGRCGPAAAPRRGRFFSPLEEQILSALSKGGWLSSNQLAEALKLADSEKLKSILTNLVDREVIESMPGRGYRLAE
jgi:hypothetical protein